jgi:GNAT superfamily N-acetyltransferase
MEWQRGDYVISDDPARIDVEAVHQFLSNDAYWSPGVPLDVVRKAIAGSIVFGLYAADGRQVGFTRVVSDRATFAWVCDVYVLPEHRGDGLGKWLMETVKSHPDLQGLRRWLLATRDAHGLYAQFGFVEAAPGSLMEIRDIDIYKRRAAAAASETIDP